MSEYTDALISDRLDKIKTHYRESPHLLGLIQIYMDQVAELAEHVDAFFDSFDIDTATGDQLTILGKILGWPRCHCVGQRRPVFGFACTDECGPPTVPIGGFCQAEWDCDGVPEYVEFCFTDDELYRGFLKARIVTLSGDLTRSGIVDGARQTFGDLATIWREMPGVVALATGRLLTNIEISIAHLYRQVLPLSPGVRLEIWHGDGPPFGFGDGWGGFCDGAFPVKITV